MIQFGNDKIKEIYHGSDKIKEVYYGLELVWSGSKPSYMILTDDTRIDFEIENTPIANLCTSLSSLVINGVSYYKSLIKEIHFGSSYSGVTEMGIRFLQDCASLTDVTLNFPALNSVGNYFLYVCTSLTDVTLDFPALNSVGSNFLRQCTSLTTVTLTAETPPNTSSSYFMNSTQRLSSIYVPANSVNLYKTTAPWSSHASKIQAYWKKPSYAILTDDTRIDFEIENTPISNLEGATTSIILNGTSYQKTTIKEITFGDSYGSVASIDDYFLINCSNLTSLDLSAFINVTSISGYFLGGCSNLTSLDLSAFINVTSISGYFLTGCSSLTLLDISAFSNLASIGINFLRGCSNLTSLDLSAFSNVASIGYSFLYNCSKLTQFKIGAVNVPQTETDWFLESTTALTTILVPMQSVQAYKTTAPWSDHASKISAI